MAQLHKVITVSRQNNTCCDTCLACGVGFICGGEAKTREGGCPGP